MVCHSKHAAERLTAIRAVVVVSTILTSNPSAAEYCVICTDPAATYRCFLPQAMVLARWQISDERAGRFCAKVLAKLEKHNHCSVESDTRKPCYGKERIVDLTDIERWSAGAETQPPSMLERSSSVLSTASDYAGSQAGKFAHAVKAAWTCAKTLFKNCGS
jgi:hypothetical protein